MLTWQEYVGTGFVFLIAFIAMVPVFVPVRKLYRFLTWRQAPAHLTRVTTRYEKIPGLVGGVGGQRRSVFGHVPKISYSYEVRGQTYTSDQIVDPMERLWFTTQVRSEGFLQKTQSRTPLNCFYNPTNPRLSVLCIFGRVKDLVAIGAAAVLVPTFLNLGLRLLPEGSPNLDFPLHPQATLVDEPSHEDDPKIWTLTTAQPPHGIRAYYDSHVADGWEPGNPWEGEEGIHTYRIWQRPTAGSQWESVVVRIRKETILVRRGFEITVTYQVGSKAMSN